jgi:hypothetical protein
VVSVYMPGRRRTGSSPERTSMSEALYEVIIDRRAEIPGRLHGARFYIATHIGR